MASDTETQLFGCPTLSMNLKTVKAKKRRRYRYSSFRERKEDFTGNVVNLPGMSGKKFLFAELEAEVDSARRIVAKSVIEKYLQTTEKHVLAAEEKMKKELNLLQSLSFPRWYQELSYDQLKHVMALEDAILKDQMENVTSLTHTCLRKIGIVSPLVRISAKTIFELQRKAQFNAVNFLREIYRVIAGNYFEDEGYKLLYSCNERIILSSIAALTFPDLANELHRQLPLKYPEFPPKPKKPKPKKHRPNSNPYEVPIPIPIDWRIYRQNLLNRKRIIESTPKPKLISFSRPITKNLSEYCLGDWDVGKSKSLDDTRRPSQSEKEDENVADLWTFNDKEISIQADLTANCGKQFSEDVPSYKIKEPLQIEDLPKKNFPQGREFMSLKMRDWFNHLDCEVSNYNKLADDLIKKVNKTVNSVQLEPTCDDCCACRQIAEKDFQMTENANIVNLIDTMVIDTEDNKQRRQLIASTAIASPRPAISVDEFPRTLEDHFSVRTPVMQGIVENEEEENANLVSGVTIYEDMVVRGGGPRREKVKLNVPSCDCLVSKDEAEKIDGPKCETSCCIGNKYRPTKDLRCFDFDFGCWHDFGSIEGVECLNYDYDKDSDIFDDKLIEECFCPTKMCDDDRLHGGSDNVSSFKEQEDSSSLSLKLYKQSLLNKTIVHLVDPFEPIKPIPVKDGENPCDCRATRFAIPKLVPGIDGPTVIENDDESTEAEEVVPIMTGDFGEGTQSKPYIAEDYIPEYELKEPISYLTCGEDNNEQRMSDRELMDYFLGPKNNLRCWEHSPAIERTIEVRRPVCECLYDRKIVREREEKERRIEREKKMQQYKKRPILDVAGSYKPIHVESKLVVAGVKEMKKEGKKCRKSRDKKDLKLCVSGISVVTTEEPLVQVISGVKLHTPFVTPAGSATSICPCFNKKQCAPIVVDSICEVKSLPISSASKAVKEEGKRVSAETMKDKETENEGKKVTRKSAEKENEKRRSKESKRSSGAKEGYDSGVEEDGVESDKQLLKKKLEKLKKQGNIFASLPKCEKVPQLKIWMTHRKGVSLTKKEKGKIVELTRKKINNIDERRIKKVEPTSFEITTKQLRKLTYDRANEMKNKISAAKNLFYSQVRQGRVERSRLYWNTFDPIRFPIKRFKQIYFAYLPGPEAHGFAYKPPWC